MLSIGTPVLLHGCLPFVTGEARLSLHRARSGVAIEPSVFSPRSRIQVTRAPFVHQDGRCRRPRHRGSEVSRKAPLPVRSGTSRPETPVQPLPARYDAKFLAARWQSPPRRFGSSRRTVSKHSMRMIQTMSQTMTKSMTKGSSSRRSIVSRGPSLSRGSDQRIDLPKDRSFSFRQEGDQILDTSPKAGYPKIISVKTQQQVTTMTMQLHQHEVMMLQVTKSQVMTMTMMPTNV